MFNYLTRKAPPAPKLPPGGMAPKLHREEIPVKTRKTCRKKQRRSKRIVQPSLHNKILLRQSCVSVKYYQDQLESV